jgi:hypothetical protein
MNINYLYLIIILCIVTFFYMYIKYIKRKICSGAPEIFNYCSNVKGPFITIIGTTHGNEQVGYYAIKKLMDRLNSKKIVLKKGKLCLIPVVNYCGFKLNVRNGLSFRDINRYYTEDTTYPINKCVLNFASKSDFTLDFHEGWGFHTTSTSLGSTITPSNTDVSNEISIKMKDNINNTIKNNMKKFIIRTNNVKLLNDPTNYKDKQNVNGTLSTYMEKINKNYILIETSGQNLIQPLKIRLDQANIFIETLLSHYNMI